MAIKNISTSTFNTFITTLRQEQKQGFMLVKFQHKAGFFCGTLSNEKMIPGIYHETLAKVDENAKELVLKKIAEIVEAAHGNVLSFVVEGEMDEYSPEKVVVTLNNGVLQKIELKDFPIVSLEEKPQQKKQRRSRKS